MHRFGKTLAFTVTAGALALAGCSQTMDQGADSAGAAPTRLVAGLWSKTGSSAGIATAEQVQGGVKITVNAEGLTPGRHGVHVHTTGMCDAPDFTTAGGHWNPTARQHGMQNPMGPHTGDLPNLMAAASGKAAMSFTIPGATLAAMREGDGSALVIHAGEDDLKTDPSGNSGGRVACGVFEGPN